MAVVLAEEVRSELPTDLIVAAWTEYGNALRIAGRYEEAERALERAAKEPTSDLPTRIHLVEVTASLHRLTRRFESALDLLLSIVEAQKSLANPDGEARTWNHFGLVCLDMGDRPGALRAFRTALDLLGPDAPLDVVISTGHNLLKALIADGRLSAAAAGLALLEPFYRRLTSPRLAAKVEWMRARLCRELQQFQAAQLAYERAYSILIKEPRSPELATLTKEMAELEAAMSSSPVSFEPERERVQGPEGGDWGEGGPTP
ncbi:MAG TPA: tetratricopeptide repeat protein [Acidobacteriaceae bacterium]|jgi:tetratricopeptide (TPR) repeat protein|nr:tetratricopeptide repeat protein [Acidobacteriaceae bacterium]